MAAFEGALKSQKDLIEELQTAYKTAALDYLASIRRGYLQQVTVDEIRKVTPGVRLQPLKDHGVTNLLACQGWTTARLEQLRGIGPESASRIALAIVALTKSVNSQPIPHPLPGAPGADKIYRPLYLVRHLRLKFFDQMPVLQAICEELEPQCASVQKRTSFIKWLFGSQKNGDLHAALDTGLKLTGKANPTEREGAALVLAKDRYAAAKLLVDGKVTSDRLIMDVAEAKDYYREGLEQLLGKNSMQRMAMSPPRSDAVPPREMKESVTELETWRARTAPAAESRRLDSCSEVSPATEPVPMRLSGTDGGVGFRISVKIGDVEIDPVPTKAATRAVDCWVPAGQSKSIGSVTLEGGLLYVGKNLPAINGRSVDPALIDPALPVATREANCRIRMLDYWSSYTYASPGARASYLQWLATGRSDPDADIGYVFLYFYGLERRVLADARTDPTARSEIPTIIAEVRRLRAIYAQRASFDRYSVEFTDYLEGARTVAVTAQETEELPLLQQYHLSFALRRKLGQFAEDRRPLPSEWAYAWYHNDPRTRLPAVASRCPVQLALLFRQEYLKQFGDGLIVAPGKTRLRLSYRPASASFGTTLDQSVDLPDVTVMSASYTKLESVALECYAQLDAYSRFIGRNKDAKDSFEGSILLPVSLWPMEKRDALEALRAKASAFPTCTLRELLAPWGKQEELSRGTYLGLCRTLAGSGLGMEPDPRFGAEIPDLDDLVALFPGDTEGQPSAGFGLAALLLRLASTVAASDGDFSDAEAQKLRQEIEANRDLNQGERRRLLARMAIYRAKTPALTGLKPAISALSEEKRQRVTDFLLTMAFADGTVAPGEVKVMEKVYTLFGLDPATLYTRLHELSAGSSPAATKQSVTGPIRLDASKVRQLREASEQITKKLAIIFNADQPPEESVPEVEKDPAGVDPTATVLVLDEAHSGLLMLLTGRPQWSRTEFEEVCADRGLMPDGAIERINEAAFSKFDQPVIDGDDPLEIAMHLLEEQLYAADNSTKGP
ncbi:MAG: TerB N-terminal domain-containing protein [Opitutae bacterium]|nr:TerB N-terminal domain-containing protein [Opitutae bacterium]